MKKENGITLIALIITIIVLLILAGVSISMVVGDNGILMQAVNASTATDVADTKEQIQVALVNYFDDSGNYSKGNVTSAVQDVLGSDASVDKNTNEDGTVTYTTTTAKGNTVVLTDLIEGANNVDLISTDESYVGYYADVNGDGEVDGVIYADLCIGGSGSWGSNGYGVYSYDAIDGCKDYYISQENYEDDFGTAGVLTATGSGEDRFYVMALDDFDSDYHYWYYSAYGNLDTTYNVLTSANDFGEGLTNTTRMIEAWNEGEYGSQNGSSTYTDLWGIIQDEYADGWFVPSKSEWACFGKALKIVSSGYYSTVGLQALYWTSSQNTNEYAWAVAFATTRVFPYQITAARWIRLSTTF